MSFIVKETFFGELVRVDYSDQGMFKVQTQTDAFNLDSYSYRHEGLTSTLYPVCIQCNSYLWLAKFSVCRFTERNDTYIFVPEGDAQSLTVNRSSGELNLNCRSCLS